MLTVTQMAAVVTFDDQNWYQPVDVHVTADPWFDLQPGREIVGQTEEANTFAGFVGGQVLKFLDAHGQSQVAESLLTSHEANLSFV